MAQRKRSPKVFNIVYFPYAAHGFIIAQRIFISQYQAAAKTKIPGKKSVDIEYIDIFISVSDKWTGNRITSLIYIGKTFIDNITPIMSRSYGKSKTLLEQCYL